MVRTSALHAECRLFESGWDHQEGWQSLAYCAALEMRLGLKNPRGSEALTFRQMLGYSSGLRGRFAKPLGALKRPEGSNPSPGANQYREVSESGLWSSTGNAVAPKNVREFESLPL